MDNYSIDQVNNQIIKCRRCPRLIPYIEQVAQDKVKRYREESYWGKPVPGFGDPHARVLILGLAPAAHGANRTGRMFTGDSSGDWLYKALYETGFANQPTSNYSDDGLEIKDIYITSTIHCAPPQNKPIATEISECSTFFDMELMAFDNLQIILCLGNIAFQHFIKTQGLEKYKFGHNHIYHIEKGRMLISSYHPSRQNTQTGKLLWHDWLEVFQNIRQHLK